MEIFVLPDVGEGLTEADIISWKVAEGDSVTINQVIVEIETAKSLVELPSPYTGVVSKIFAREGDNLQVGQPLVGIGGDVGSDDSGDSEGEKPLVGSGPIAEGPSGRRRRRHGQAVEQTGQKPTSEPEPAVQPEPPAEPELPAEPEPTVESEPIVEPNTKRAGHYSTVLATPPVRKLAKECGIDLAEVPATGQHGEVTRKDLESFTPSTPSTRSSGEVELVPVKSLRKVTAKAVTDSYQQAPHATVFQDVDVTRCMEFIKRLKASDDFADVKVSPLLILGKAIIRAVKRNPMANAKWAGENIEVYSNVNLGIAAATPRGLMVPNIKNAHEKSLHELAKDLTVLVTRAREGKTQPAELAGGTISITNIGTLGLDSGAPILNGGESAIIVFGAIKEKPWVVDGQIQVRKVATIGGSFDHRVVDGDGIALFMRDIVEVMEEPGLLATA